MSIPPILHNDNLIFDDIERANLFNIYFSKQSEIDDSNSNIPNLLHVTNQISEIKLCENEVEDVLKVINPTKASGPDLINPRLLKEATPIIKHSLCKLFTLFRSFYTRNLFNYVPPVFARRIHVCNFCD
jgi:hypothetical protein